MTQEFPARRPERPPTHPGAILREDVLPTLGMRVTEAAQHMHITRQMLHRILSEQASISPEMAVRLGKFCGNGAGLWLRMQQAHDLWQAEEKLKDEVGRIRTFGRAA